MLPGTTFGEIQDAIVDAFDRADLAKALRRQMNLRLDVVVAEAGFDDQVFELVQWAELEGRVAELVEVLAAERPRHAGLQQLGRQIGATVALGVAEAGAAVAGAPTDTAGAGVEKIVRPHLAFVDLGVWREKLAAIERRVAMVRLGGDPQGTGFLVGADLLLTNWHVARPLLEGRRDAAEMDFLFDYKRLSDGSITRTQVALHPSEWQVDACPCAALELEGRADEARPTADELDYALLRLAEPIGERPWAPGARADEAPPRGWISPPRQPYAFRSPMGVMIAQHPAGWPLKLALDTAGIDKGAGRWLNPGGTRIRYAANTEGGSSGSPVFDLDWNLIALHHYGDPGFGHPPSYNQGVPFTLIRDRLRRVRGQDLPPEFRDA